MASISGISGSAAILKIFHLNYSQLPIFILILFWEIKKFLMNGLHESACIVYFFLVGGGARRLRNPATKCDLPIGYFMPLTNMEIAFRCRIS
jgi:hypothetical protein